MTCGIPSVTLEGEKADWEKLYKRLDRLPELGNQPEQWTVMLRPILRRFVDAFDGNPDVTFWEHVVDRKRRGCGTEGLSGWITAFCVWNLDGKWLAPNQAAGTVEDVSSGRAPGRQSSVSQVAISTQLHIYYAGVSPRRTGLYSGPDYTLDGVHYFSLDETDIPAGYSEVDVLVDDNGETFECKMVSGHVASAASKAVEDGPFDTLSPAPQWFLYVKADKPRRGYEEEAMERIEGLRKKHGW